MPQNSSSAVDRRQLLASVAAISVFAALSPARGQSFSKPLPWHPFAADPPRQVLPNGWLFFTPQEARTIEAIVDRIIPADDLGAGGKDAGCAVFIDRQLAGSFGDSRRLYMQGPFLPGLPSQGYQGSATPTARYRSGLAAIDTVLRTTKSNRGFADLDAAEQDQFLKDLEAGKIELDNKIDGRALFNLILQNTMEGFFADPIYGGNRDMVSWKLIGFPGARYDYRDHIGNHNKPYPRGPVSIAGSPEWSRRS